MLRYTLIRADKINRAYTAGFILVFILACIELHKQQNNVAYNHEPRLQYPLTLACLWCMFSFMFLYESQNHDPETNFFWHDHWELRSYIKQDNVIGLLANTRIWTPYMQIKNKPLGVVAQELGKVNIPIILDLLIAEREKMKILLHVYYSKLAIIDIEEKILANIAKYILDNNTLKKFLILHFATGMSETRRKPILELIEQFIAKDNKVLQYPSESMLNIYRKKYPKPRCPTPA